MVLAVRGGGVKRWGVWFDRHLRLLFNFFLRLTANRGLSEDLVQEVFFRMLKYRHTFQAGTNFTAGMFQITRNAQNDQARKHRGGAGTGQETGSGGMGPACWRAPTAGE